MKYAKLAMALSALMVTLAGCSSTPTTTAVTTKPAEASTAAKPAEAPMAKPTVLPSTQASANAIPPYLDPNSALSTTRSIYFDFDNFMVKKEFERLLEMHGKYLAKNPTIAIKIEGSSDERGGIEYNLALGQKRAEAVAKALQIYGVKSSQIESVSWGEEKPKNTGHDEAAWAENRRADLVYPKR